MTYQEDPIIEIGHKMPDFQLLDADGYEHKLSDYLGHKVMLCFYRYVYCPISAMSVGKLMGNYKKLAWASKLKVVTVFRTKQEWLKKGLTSEDAPIARLCNGITYPFLPLADPDGKAGAAFNVNNKSKLNHLLSLASIRGEVMKYHGTSSLSTPASRLERKSVGARTLIPSELLIDEHGVLVDILRPEKYGETMTMDRISYFLLFGKKLPEENGSANKERKKKTISSIGTTRRLSSISMGTTRRLSSIGSRRWSIRMPQQ